MKDHSKSIRHTYDTIARLRKAIVKSIGLFIRNNGKKFYKDREFSIDTDVKTVMDVPSVTINNRENTVQCISLTYFPNDNAPELTFSTKSGQITSDDIVLDELVAVYEFLQVIESNQYSNSIVNIDGLLTLKQ